MKYLAERSLFYYFLMREAMATGIETWSLIAETFGVCQKLIKDYKNVLSDPILNDLVTTNDIDVYKNFISGFFAKMNALVSRERNRIR